MVSPKARSVNSNKTIESPREENSLIIVVKATLVVIGVFVFLGVIICGYTRMNKGLYETI